MTDKTLYILRGVSGSGKTSLAKTLEQLPNTKAVAADDFWYIVGKGEYAFDIKRLGEAHDWCKECVRALLTKGEYNIVLHNTTTSEKELLPYLHLAEILEYKVVSLVVEKRHTNSNVHQVPKEVLINQAKRLRVSTKFG